jgi:hypothetical protein
LQQWCAGQPLTGDIDLQIRINLTRNRMRDIANAEPLAGSHVHNNRIGFLAGLGKQ